MSERTKLPEVERLRAIAILMVLEHHMGYLASVRPSLLAGWTGVDLFFVISGYVVTLSLIRMIGTEREPTDMAIRFAKAVPQLKAFFVRRVFRILPLAVLAAGIYLAGALFFNHSNAFGAPRSVLKEFIAFLTLQHNYYITYSGIASNGTDTIGHYWSLTVEEHFYLLLPLLLVGAGTRARRILWVAAGIALVALIVRPLLTTGEVDFAYYRFLSHNRFDSLLSGVLLALVVGKPASTVSSSPKWVWSTIVILLVGGIWVAPNVVGPDVMRRIGFISVWSMSCGLIYLASLDRGYVFGWPVIGRVLEYIGARSYTLYLIHLAVIRAQTEAAYRYGESSIGHALTGTVPGQVVVGVVAMVVLAEILYRTVEMPLRDVGARLAARIRSEAVAS